MVRSASSVSVVALALVVLLLAPGKAWAYVGPGTGLTAIGVLLAVIGTIFFAIVGLVWYPVKRLIRFIKLKAKSREGQN